MRVNQTYLLVALLATVILVLSTQATIPLESPIEEDSFQFPTFSQNINETFQSQETTAFDSQQTAVPDPDRNRIKNYFTHYTNHGYHRISAALYKDGKIWTAQTGYLDSTKKAVNASTKYRVASITKTFVAVLIMKAIEEGKLTLRSTLSQYLPANHGIKNADKITIEMMLNHRAFLYNFTEDPDFNIFQTHTFDDVIAVLKKHQDEMPAPDSQPAGQYSNAGYYLLGMFMNCVCCIQLLQLKQNGKLHQIHPKSSISISLTLYSY